MFLLSRREMLAMTGMSIAYGMIQEPFLTITAHSSSPLPRMPLEEFVQSASMLSALRKGVTEMKKRKPSDPLSWFYQAAIHGVTDEAIKKAAVDDPNVTNVPKDRWNQCPHHGENSANFLPWHRGYTYYFEKILADAHRRR
jgi:tyrosinase-like protein